MGNEYQASDIQVLEGLNAVRVRPGMYIGSTGSRGLHHMLWEIVDNAIDEAMGGYADLVTVTLNQDGSATVTDNGRGRAHRYPSHDEGFRGGSGLYPAACRREIWR